jgi:hypothetical protein
MIANATPFGQIEVRWRDRASNKDNEEADVTRDSGRIALCDARV